jgi:hypothetical protein
MTYSESKSRNYAIKSKTFRHIKKQKKQTKKQPIKLTKTNLDVKVSKKDILKLCLCVCM